MYNVNNYVSKIHHLYLLSLTEAFFVINITTFPSLQRRINARFVRNTRLMTNKRKSSCNRNMKNIYTAKSRDKARAVNEANIVCATFDL